MFTFKQYKEKLDLSLYPDDFSPCHRRVLSARSITAEQLAKPLSALLPVKQLTDAKKAAKRIYLALCQKEKIVIAGDYDADGATAMAIMVAVFRHVKASYDTVVPNRISMGYGLSDKAVDEVLHKKAKLLITVDNGISAVDSVQRLKKNNIDVIITDHHLPPDVLPSADIIVNPNRKDCSFTSKSLAGVGVAFYVMLALRQVFRENCDTRLDNFPLTGLLPLVAIGTIADVVPLDFNNRILVEQGLKRIRAGHCTAGVSALITVSNLNQSNLTSSNIGFQIAPRLNAAGRIADMQLGVDCLLATNDRVAMDYAIELNRLNHERRTIENEMRVQADALLLEKNLSSDTLSICLLDTSWNEGLIGILAARLKENNGKTTFIFTAANNQLLKGSARAGHAVNLIDALNELNRQNPQLLSNYGGHRQAAGLSIHPEKIETFTVAIESIIRQQLAGKMIDDHIYTDGELLPYELDLANAEFLRLLEPWGSELPEPLFENTFYIDQIREVGKNHAQLALIEEKSGLYFKGIAFNQFTSCQAFKKRQCRLAYRLDINEWRGERTLSLQVMYINPI